MEPPLPDQIDIQTGGCAPVTTYVDGQWEFCYAPSAYEGFVTGSDATFVVELNGILTVVYKPSATVGYRFGGAADAIAPGIFTGTGGIVTNGAAPVIFRNAATGVDLYDYAPSLYEGYVTNGDALFVIQRNGVICVDYKPFVETQDGYVTDGDALIVAIVDGILCADYKPFFNGYVTGGSADAEATITSARPIASLLIPSNPAPSFLMLNRTIRGSFPYFH